MDAPFTEVDHDKKVVRTGTRILCTCPHCHKTLQDGSHLRLHITRADGARGVLRLSPYLNVFDSSSTIGVPEGEEVADMSCPMCCKSLKLPERSCDECGSSAAHFYARIDDEDIDFFICMRNNCHWHGISEKTRSQMILEAEGFHHPDRHTELIRSGTKLQTFCPNCSGDLVQGEELIVHIVDADNNRGLLKLSPHLNVFRAECTLTMPRGQQPQDLLCPKCDKSLIVDERRCELCGGRAAKFRVKTSADLVDFYICSRRQCHWHGLDDRARRVLLGQP